MSFDPPGMSNGNVMSPLNEHWMSNSSDFVFVAAGLNPVRAFLTSEEAEDTHAVMSIDPDSIMVLDYDPLCLNEQRCQPQ